MNELKTDIESLGKAMQLDSDVFFTTREYFINKYGLEGYKRVFKRLAAILRSESKGW